MNYHPSFQLHQEALNALPSSLVVLDQHGVIVHANLAWEHFGHVNGLSPSYQSLGKNYIQLCQAVQTSDAQAAAQGLQQVLTGETTEYLQVYPCHGPHQEYWFQLRATRIPNGPFLLVVHEDVTQLKAAEQALEEEAEFTRSLMVGTPDCLELLNFNHELVWMNEVGQNLLHLDEVVPLYGTSWLNFWSTQDQQDVLQALKAATLGGRGQCQAHRSTASGKVMFWDVVITGLHDAAGGVTQLLVTSRDLTALQQAREQAAMSAEQSRLVLENMFEAWFLVDRDWRFLSLNSQAETLLHHPASALLGEKLWDAFPEAVETESDLQYHTALREQRTVQFEQFYAPLNTWFEVRAFPTLSGLTVYFHDINAKKREEQAQCDRNVILEMTVQDRPLPDILLQVAVMVEGQYPGYACTILIEEAGRLYTSAAPSMPIDFQQAVDGLEVREGAGVCGTAAFRSEVVMVEDTVTDPACAQFHPLLLAYGLRACVSLPIIDGQKIVLGALALYNTVPGPFSAEILDDLGKAQHLAAVAIEHTVLAKRLLYQTRHDALTGLANRVLYEERLQACVKAAQDTDTPAALLFIDVDDFKAVNDSLGHHVGDEVLRALATRLRTCVRLGDTLARISGDEFTVILPHSTEMSAVEVTQRCLKSFDLPFYVAGREIYITASIGVSVLPDGGRDAETLQRNADLAMYHAKSRKTGWAVFEPSLNRQAFQRFQLAAYLRRAIELNELELHFQPQITLDIRRIVGVEALLRWRHPSLGMVSPAHFIPVAEETGLIVAIGDWVMLEACRQGMRWRHAGRPAIRIAVNVSSLQFEREDFVERVQRCLDETGFPADYLELELTERLVMHNVDASVLRMKRLRALGVSIAIDDFGTGYSSLSYLPRLPINILKIDRSFIMGLREGSANAPVVRAILSLAASLGLMAIAEGIETHEELAVLQSLGCTLGQGYLLARPTAAHDIRWTSG